MIGHMNTGRSLIIANPQAQSGRSRMVAERLQRFLALINDDAFSFDLVYTERPRHAVELARDATGYQTVIALGGDGVIHEVANGLMHHPRVSRPALGIVPVGSGNDYALTLGLPICDGDDFAYLLDCEPRRLDIGQILLDAGSDNERTEFFVETCSAGIDAAIAIDTYQLRRTTHLKGGALYLASGLRQFGRRYRMYPLAATFDHEQERPLTPYLLAIQIGPTYGSGFRICPEADPTDGVFDVCYAQGPAPRAVTLPAFLSARHGGHTTSPIIHFTRARRVRLGFPAEDYPLQADGEKLTASSLDISILPGALTVLAPAR